MARRLRQVRSEDGFALLVVLGGMLALSLVLMATLTYVVNSLPTTRRAQDTGAAIQAAQAGVDDYLARLTTCDSYWKDRCGAAATTNPALAGWASIPFSAGTNPAQYHYDVLRTPEDEPGLLRVRATGRILQPGGKSSKRSIVVDLRKDSFLKYIYYTDHESSDPASVLRRYPARVVNDTRYQGYNAIKYNGVTSAEADKCNRYWYPSGATPARNQSYLESFQVSNDGGNTFPAPNTSTYTTQRSCDIQFAPIDVLDGDAYTRDAILLDNPLFTGSFISRWAAGSTTPGPTTNQWYRIVSGGTDPQGAGFRPSYADKDIALPPSNAAIKDKTDPAKGGQDGCPYTGPTRIVLNADGTMTVTSPLTRATNPGCGLITAAGVATQTLALPKNKVVFVESSTEACTGRPTAFPLDPIDLTSYSCKAGDVFLQGTLAGRLTVAARNDITVTGSVLYKNGIGGSSADVLGLIANGDVEVYHPVKCTNPPPAGFFCNDFTNIDVGLTNIELDAAILSVNHSFTVQNFDKGAKLGNLTVKGGIYQYFRGAVGTGGGTGTGYAKDYRYDKRLKSLPPPSFLDPVAAPWAAGAYAEVKLPTGLPS